MKTLITLLAIICPLTVFGKAAYYKKADAIQNAPIIAIVDIQSVEETKTKTKGWTYSQVAHADVEQVLKGELPATVKLYGGENFICAQVNYKPGRHLVFLRQLNGLYTGVNWHLGVLKIEGDSVEWFENNNSITLKPALLTTALSEIETVLQTEWPVLVHVERGGRSPQPQLHWALWQDGAVLFFQDGKLFTGTIDPESFRTLWETLRAAKFFTTAREHYVVPDSSYETIMVRLRNESAIHSWHGVLRPGFGGNIETDAEYRAFVEMWKTSEAAIHSITPDDVRPVEQRASDGNFRGYIVDEPSKTDWLNVRAWKHQIE